MIRDVVTLSPQDPVTEAIALMAEERVSAIPVVDAKRRCVGVLSVTDLVRLAGATLPGAPDPDELLGAGAAHDHGQLVRDVMETRVLSVKPEEPVLDAAREMVRSRVHRLVVIDGDDRVQGIVSTMDLLEALTAE